MLELIHSLPGFVSQVLQANPNQHRATQMITLAAVNPTFAIANASQLFLFAVKLLNLPPMPALFLSGFGAGLSQIVGDDVFRPIGRDNDAEPSSFKAARAAK